jgi:hypothetical protein
MSDLSNLLDSFSEHKEEIATVYDKFSWMWEPRATITETPRAGFPEGQDSAPTNSTVDKAADVITMGTNFYTQLKGLFGLGYPANVAQPVSPIQHEITKDTTPAPVIAGMSVGTIAVIAIVLLFLMKK